MSITGKDTEYAIEATKLIIKARTGGAEPSKQTVSLLLRIAGTVATEIFPGDPKMSSVAVNRSNLVETIVRRILEGK